MAKFEIVAVGAEGQYTVKEHLDVTGVSDRVALLTAQNVDLAARNVDLQSQVDALMTEIDLVMVNIEGYLLADPPDIESAQKLIEYSNTLSTQAGKYNREIAANGITITSNQKTIDALNALLNQQDIVQDAVCTDGDDTLTVGQVVGSVELDRYPAAKTGSQKVIIRPGSSATWNSSRDGVVRPARVMGPSELFVNQALMPSAQIYLPRYVAAVIDALDTDLDTADVSVYASSNNHPATWWEGATPVRLPAGLLTGIPVAYLDCNASAFDVGDHVVVEYIGDQPTVIGFIDNPKPCATGFLAVATPIDFASVNTIYCNDAFDVDWGSGSYTAYPAGNASAVASGDITVRSNSCTNFKFITNTYSAVSITKADSITNMYKSFYQLSNLTSFASVALSNVTNLSNAWNGCSGLTSFPLIDISSLITASSAWRDCSGLTSFPLIDTSSVLYAGSAWEGCSGLTSFPLLDLSNVLSVSSSWQGCSGLTSFPAIDLPFCTGAGYAWYKCSGLTSFPLINIGSATSLSHAWHQCSGLTSFPMLDTSSAQNLSWAWYGCSGLTGFPLLNASAATDVSYAWRGCSGLSGFPVINTSLVTNFAGAWRDCIGLTSFPSLDVSAGISFSTTWYNCSGLSSFPTLIFTAATDLGYAWYYCTGLSSFPAIAFPAATNLTYTWANCVGLTSFPATDFPVGSDFSFTFYECTGILIIGALGTSMGTIFTDMFRNNAVMTTIFALDTTNTSTSNPSMFAGCVDLASPDSAEQTSLRSVSGYDFN